MAAQFLPKVLPSSCIDQFLRYFLMALRIKYKGEDTAIGSEKK